MILILLGPPGSGKGTQAKLLHQKLNLIYFEAGRILREKAKEENKLGKKIDELINKKGVLVPDSIMKMVLKDFFQKKNLKKGIIFDGFPRNLSQYQILQEFLKEKGLKIDKVFLLEVSDKTIIFRLSQRRICSKCGLEYNLATRPPKNDEICDQCQVKLISRPDDTPKLIKNRLKIYKKETQPLINEAEKNKILVRINGERKIKEIYQEILANL
ncbi:MAG: adenylate kinase family protein [Microgenomates group bacterium]